MADDEPSPIDIHVGRRVTVLRTAAGLSQADLGRHLGITFQQVQKYEKGKNRISASKLWQVAELLQVDIRALFDGLDGYIVDDDSGELTPPTTTTREIIRLAMTLDVDQQRVARDVIRTLLR